MYGLPDFIKGDYELSLETTIEVDRTYNTTGSAQKRVIKGRVQSLRYRVVCTKTIPKLILSNIDLGIYTTKKKKKD